MLKNSPSRYGLVAVLLHWLAALTIIGLFALGFWMVDLGYYDPWYHDAPFIHKSIGILLAILMLLRLVWRFYDSPPASINSHSLLEKKIASLAHRIIYLLAFLIVFSGYLISTADGKPIEVFNWFTIPALQTLIENQEDLAGTFHKWLAYLLIAIALLHALAALKHHFIDKDNTLKRITLLGDK